MSLFCSVICLNKNFWEKQELALWTYSTLGLKSGWRVLQTLASDSPSLLVLSCFVVLGFFKAELWEMLSFSKLSSCFPWAYELGFPGTFTVDWHKSLVCSELLMNQQGIGRKIWQTSTCCISWTGGTLLSVSCFDATDKFPNHICDKVNLMFTAERLTVFQ